MRHALMACLVLSAAAGVGAGPLGRLEVGKPLPEVAFTALEDGRPITLQQYGGQKLVLHVFASW